VQCSAVQLALFCFKALSDRADGYFRYQNVSIELHAQGDQIGRIFAFWAIVFFGQNLENYRNSANFWATFFHDTIYIYIGI
jgi:hypothetical protein